MVKEYKKSKGIPYKLFKEEDFIKLSKGVKIKLVFHQTEFSPFFSFLSFCILRLSICILS